MRGQASCLPAPTLHIPSPLTAQAYHPTSGEWNDLLQYYLLLKSLLMFILMKLMSMICQQKFIRDQDTVQVEICESWGRQAYRR
jgi:hypothetical protein